jgi:protease I
MKNSLEGKKVAILATDGFEETELTEPQKALEKAGARTEIVSLKEGKIKSWKTDDWGSKFKVDKTLDEAYAEDYDALLMPGGVMNPDHLRKEQKAIEFVRRFFDSGKPVAAICHGPWTLINADVVKGRRMTSYESLRMDLKNAGAEWVDEEVVVDQGLITSRTPNDLPAFIDKMIEEIEEGRHKGQAASKSAATAHLS